MDRQQHLQWCKKRALEYLDRGDVVEAYASMANDMMMHPETEGHSALSLGTMLMIGGHLSTVEKMRKFIEGFN